MQMPEPPDGSVQLSYWFVRGTPASGLRTNVLGSQLNNCENRLLKLLLLLLLLPFWRNSGVSSTLASKETLGNEKVSFSISNNYLAVVSDRYTTNTFVKRGQFRF